MAGTPSTARTRSSIRRPKPKPTGSSDKSVTVTVAELRSDFKAVEAKLAKGIRVQVTRRGEVVAELNAPVEHPSVQPKHEVTRFIDFLPRWKRDSRKCGAVRKMSTRLPWFRKAEIVIFFLDTSFLIKLYIDEPDSRIALNLLRRDDPEPTISWLSEVEMSTAIYARAARAKRDLAASSVDLAYAAFQLDTSSGRYSLISMDQGVFEYARLLGELYGGTLQVRALDILHVAAAVRHRAAIFGTFDQRQAKLAEAAGLKLLS